MVDEDLNQVNKFPYRLQVIYFQTVLICITEKSQKVSLKRQKPSTVKLGDKELFGHPKIVPYAKCSVFL